MGACRCADPPLSVPRYRLALRVAKGPRFERLPAMSGGTYADDDLVERVQAHRCYIGEWMSENAGPSHSLSLCG